MSNTHAHQPGKALDKATTWLDTELFPLIGPPPLGPYDKPELDPPDVILHQRCPICRHPMSEHTVELSTDNGHVYLRHPDDSFHELMETGRSG